MTERTVLEVKARCRSILDDSKVIELVKGTRTPTAAYEVVFAETGSDKKAKAARWLAVLRRDYPAEYAELILTLGTDQATAAR